MGCTTSGHWARGCRGAGRTGKAGAAQQVRTLVEAGRLRPEQSSGAGKCQIFYGVGGVSVSQSPYTWGRGPVPPSHSSRQCPPPPSWKSGQSDLRVRPFAGSSGGGSYTPRGEKGAPEEGGSSG